MTRHEVELDAGDTLYPYLLESPSGRRWQVRGPSPAAAVAAFVSMGWAITEVEPGDQVAEPGDEQ